MMIIIIIMMIIIIIIIIIIHKSFMPCVQTHISFSSYIQMFVKAIRVMYIDKESYIERNTDY